MMMASRSSRPTSASGVQRGSPLESADIKNRQANDHDFDVGDNIARGQEGGDSSPEIHRTRSNCVIVVPLSVCLKQLWSMVPLGKLSIVLLSLEPRHLSTKYES